MRIIAHIFLLTATIIMPMMAISAEYVHPLGTDPFAFDYDRQFRLGLQRADLKLIPPTGPYFLGDSAILSTDNSSPANNLFRPGSSYVTPNDSLRLFTLGAERYRMRRQAAGENLPALTAGFAYRADPRFGATAFFNLDRAKALDPDYTGKKYRGLAGDVETAVIYYTSNKISVMLGRTRLFWGPQRVNLVISETAEPMDMFSASYHTSRLAFTFLFARLDGSRPNELDSLRFPDRTFNDNRYLVGHRLDINLCKTVRVGLFETVLYGGEGRPPELYYLNPLQFFHGAQLNENEDDNTILGCDVTYVPGHGFGVYGQLIVDDFQIDDQSQGDKEPNELGFMAGIIKTGKTSTLIPDIKVEYVRLTNRTYHQRDPRNRYLFRNKPIGHPLGPDADSVAISARFWPTKTFSAEVELAYRRMGEGSLYKPWDEPWLLAAGEYDEPFPTGVIEKAGFVAARAQGYLPLSNYIAKHFFVSVDAGWGEIHNYLNTPGQTATTAWFDITLTWLGLSEIAVD